MSTALRTPTRPRPDHVELDGGGLALGSDPRYQSYLVLRTGFTVLPIIMGIDKFFNLMVSWPQYLADWIDNIVPGTAQQLMYAVGVLEIAAGLFVALRPRWGAYVVGAWLAGIVVNLLSYGEWYDVAVRDFGLMLGAFALARLAAIYDR